MGGSSSKQKPPPSSTARRSSATLCVSGGGEKNHHSGTTPSSSSSPHAQASAAKPSASSSSTPPSTTKINSYDRCMLQLKLQRDKLNAASRLYERKAEVERETAKQLLSEGKREKALYCLKRRKAQEVHLERVQKYLDNIFTMMQNVESKQLDNEVAMALKQGTEELTQLNAHLSLDDIEQIMESAAEQIQITTEASALLSQNLVSLDEDDDDILNELDALCAADKNKNNAAATAKKATSQTTAQNNANAVADLNEVKVPTGPIAAPIAEKDDNAVSVQETESGARVAVAV